MKYKMVIWLLASWGTLLLCGAARAENWPQWRAGPPSGFLAVLDDFRARWAWVCFLIWCASSGTKTERPSAYLGLIMLHSIKSRP